MKHQLGKITANATAKALREAEAQLEKPEVTDGRPVYVDVKPDDIKERLELFQPRRPGYGLHTLDTKHVNKLKTRIERKGEIDPPLIVKLWGQWIVVDGHHRLAAYRKLNHKAPIKCQWFAGSVRAAMDASLHRNEKIHLPIDQGDKAEAAWTRTVLDWNGKTWSSSKQEVVKLTGCGEGTVAQMRRVLKWHHKYMTGTERHPTGEKLYTALGRDLSQHSWSTVRRTLLDLSPHEQDANEAAAKLARALTTRLTDWPSRDPEVTAQALWLYDRDLCPKLVEALQARIEKETKQERDLEDQAAYEDLEARYAPPSDPP